MKKIKKVFVFVICIVIVLPVINFNFESPSVSEIDNRNLTEFDIHCDDRAGMVDSYIKDRVGFRNEMLNSFTVMNDKVFSEMVHPSYTYGRDGYVFLKVAQENLDTEFIDAFCVYLKKVQIYCEKRGVPFIYCLNPGKISVYSEYLPQGYNYQNKFITYMEQVLKEQGVNYISNYELLKEKSREELVFNKKFDAGHWNDLGAFYGVNHILNKVGEYFPNVRENKKEDFEITTTVEESLPVSYFKIHEEVPQFVSKEAQKLKNLTEKYSAIKLNSEHRSFVYIENEKEQLPTILFFRGSYMNKGDKFVFSRVGKDFAVHNYENFLDFEYYFNIAQPDCVVLETAEYATSRVFFEYEKMIDKEFNEVLPLAEKEKAIPISEYQTECEINDALTKITVNARGYSKGYLLYEDIVFDLSTEKGNRLSCTIDSKYYDKNKLKIVLY